MGKFKVGDKVRLVSPSSWSQGTALGTIREVRPNSAYRYEVSFGSGGCLPLNDHEIFAVEPNPYVGQDKSLEKKTKIQLVEIITNQRGEITKLVKEIEVLKNLKPAIAVQPIQAGQLVETVTKIPALDPKYAWIKKGKAAKILVDAPHYYEFMSDPRYSEKRGCWVVDTRVVHPGETSHTAESTLYPSYVEYKIPNVWETVKVGDRIKVTIGNGSPGFGVRSYEGRVFKKGTHNALSFIVDKRTGDAIWTVGEMATVYQDSTCVLEILKD